MKQKKNDNFTGSVTEVRPVYGNLATMISTTGEVKPQNRLEIMPPIAGRIEKIYVREGDKVKTGDILALMSSTERAALLDAAQLNGKEEIEYWEKVYNATPLISPIDAEVIVRAVEPGQAVVATDAVIVLSDRLIVQADVDETDIGDVKVGCGASVSLDAYPRIEVNAVVDHISYESTLVNNVTIYEVDILPESIPDVFRSGMSANVDIITKSKNHVLIIPLKAVREEKGQNFVLLKSKGNGIVRQPVALGLSDSENVEVVSGISEDDSVIITTEKYLLSESKESGSNPFMPNFEKRRINKPSESRSLK
jgi:macrolide-specific efflux system membrane fusion protein